MTEMYNRLITMLKDKLGIFIGVILTALLYTFTLSFVNPVIITNAPTEQIVVTAGKTFVLCRTVEYTRGTEITISRALTREIELDTLETINFDNITMPKKKGKQHICRNIRIPPTIPSGIWDFHTYIKVYTTPWWYTSFESPTISMRVIGVE